MRSRHREVRDLIWPFSEAFSGEGTAGRQLSDEEREHLDELVDQLRERQAEAFRHAQAVRIAGPIDMHQLIPQLTNAVAYLASAASERVRSAKSGQPSPGFRSSWSYVTANLGVELGKHP
jgi:hypothetical protein